MGGRDGARFFRQSLQGRAEACAVSGGDCYKAHGTLVSGGAVRDAWCLGRFEEQAAGVGLRVEAHGVRGRVLLLGKEGLRIRY